VRVGFGFDVHAFATNRPLVLGGVEIPYERGLLGHSDGDALCHAIADALLGASALGDIGLQWPATVESRDASSLAFLTVIADLMAESGFEVGNVDSTIVAEEPQLNEYREQMITGIAAALRVGTDLVSVKATTSDRLGFAGRGEGVAAYAVATVSKVER
jgi:2-C-methyl-D-erythritol 2,4-cyclodiphosphate synthase